MLCKCFRPSLCVFSPYLGVCGGGGVPRGLRHNLRMQFSNLGSSKMEISATGFFYILTIQNDKISYVKHVLAPLHVFSTLFGCWGGGSQGGWGTTCLCGFLASATQKWSFLSPLRGALPKAMEFFGSPTMLFKNTWSGCNEFQCALKCREINMRSTGQLILFQHNIQAPKVKGWGRQG